jgi:hypothetical protein
MENTNQSDHDLLIKVDTKLGMLIQTQGQYLEQYGKLLERVVQVELDRGRDKAQFDELRRDVDELRKKSTIIDAINAGVAAIAGALAVWFGIK